MLIDAAGMPLRRATFSCCSSAPTIHRLAETDRPRSMNMTSDRHWIVSAVSFLRQLLVKAEGNNVSKAPQSNLDPRERRNEKASRDNLSHDCFDRPKFGAGRGGSRKKGQAKTVKRMSARRDSEGHEAMGWKLCRPRADGSASGRTRIGAGNHGCDPRR